MPSRADSGRPFVDAEHLAWHGLLRTHALVVRRLDEELSRRHRLSVSEFDVLITLANAHDQELRMTELAEAVMLTPSGVSRLVGRLEREGLVARRPAGDDGRSFRTRLTAAGAEALDEARHTHNAVVRELYLDRLDAAARKQLGSAWAAVLTP